MSKVAILPHADVGPPETAVEARELQAAWHGDTLFVRWRDVHPGRLVPADGAVLEIRYVDARGRSVTTWDDDPDLEVRAVGTGEKGYVWEAQWRPQLPPKASITVTLLERRGLGRRSIDVAR